MPSVTQYPKERIEFAARIYHTSRDAAQAIGLTHASFTRLCRQYGIENPHTRHQRHRHVTR